MTFDYFSEQMEVELQGQDLKSVIEMEDSLLQQKGEVCFKILFKNAPFTSI